MKNSFARLIIVLTIISIGSGLVLALTYNSTIPVIKAIAAREQKEAILETLPGASKYEEISGAEFPMYKGLDDAGNVVGFAYVAEGGGFQGVIRIMVGVNPDEEVLTSIKVLSHSETPGLGARITEAWFQDQFKGKSVKDNFVAKEDVEAITGATISSDAVSTIIKQSLPKAIEQYKALGGGR